MVEGPLSLIEAFDHGAHVVVVYLTIDAMVRWPMLVERAEHRGVDLSFVSDSVMEAMAETRSPQGALGICKVFEHGLADVLTSRSKSIVILEALSDPGNVGTIIRTADAAGVGGVITMGDGVDPYNGKCVRASAGSIFHVPVASCLDSVDVLSAVRAHGATVVVATADGELDLFDWLASEASITPAAWVFGSEAHGVSESMKSEADVRVRIPLYGSAESLNVSSAAAVCLYAQAHRRHERIGPSA